MANQRQRVLDLLSSRNGGHRQPPPPPAVPVDTTTGDDGRGEDRDLAFQQAMFAVLNQALDSDIDLHRDQVNEAGLVLLTRVAVELGNIRYLLEQAIGEDG